MNRHQIPDHPTAGGSGQYDRLLSGLAVARHRYLAAREEMWLAREAYAEEIVKAERLLGLPHRPAADQSALLKPQAG